MARQGTTEIYYGKAFLNAKRCLREASNSGHPYATRTQSMRNPSTGLDEQVMAIDSAVLWCIKFHLPEWSQGTWRMIRCGYRMLLKKMKDKGLLSLERFDALEKKMMSSKGLSRSQRKKNTSSRRKKAISPEHLLEIEGYVKNNQPIWGEALVIWLHASIATGLRPNEWLTAELKEIDGRIILRTENFKFNEVRSYDSHREIDITNLPDDLVRKVRQQINVVQGVHSEGIYDRYYKGCSNLLLHINKKLWPRRKANIQLYTGRHQFSANAKASESTSDAERAAMMGHGTTKTSRERYGRKRNGGGGLTPEIADKEVLKKIATPEVKQRPSNTPAAINRSPEKGNGS